MRIEILMFCFIQILRRMKLKKMGFKKIEDIQKYLDNNRISQNDKIKITIVPTGRFVRLRK